MAKFRLIALNLLRKDKIEKKGHQSEREKKKKIVGNFKIRPKSSLLYSYFLNDKLLVPRDFKNSIIVQKSILFFIPWFERGRERVGEFWLKRESLVDIVFGQEKN